MNNISSPTNFKSSPIASPMAPNLNASMPMMGGRRKRNRKTHKKGGMDPVTPEKEKKFQVAPVDEKGEIIKPKNLFGNDEVVKDEVVKDEVAIDIADDEDYGDLENIPDEPKIVEDENEKIDILSEMESGNLESRGGTRRRKRRTTRNKTNKKSKKTKRRGSNKKTRKTRKLNKK